MALLQFDARTVAPQVGMDPVPEGWYKCAIVKSNIKPTRDQQSGLLELILQVIEGQYQGRMLFWNLNLFNTKSQQAVEIAYKQLSAICHVVGQYQVQDQAATDHAVPMLHNIPFLAHAVVATGERGPINNIVGVKDINGNDPGKQGMGPQGGQPGAQPPGGFGGPVGGGMQPGGFGPPGGGQPGGFVPQNAGPSGGMAPGGALPGGWQAPPGQAPGWGGPQGGAAPGPQQQGQPQQWAPPGNVTPPNQPPPGQQGGWTTGQPTQPAQPPQQQQAPGGWTPGQNQQPQPGQFQPQPGPGGGAPPNAPWSR